MLSNEYEKFSMAKKDNIKEMYGRLSTLVYKSKMLGKPYSELEVVRKILRILPRNFEAKVTTIQESKDLKIVEVEELIGNLITYEMKVKFREVRKSGDSKKKSIALKRTVDSDEEEDEAETELAIVMKRFKKWTQKYENPAINQRIKTKITKVLDDSEEDEIIHYRCNKLGHIKPNCSLNQPSKGKKKKQRSFAATWDDTEEEVESSDSDNKKQICASWLNQMITMMMNQARYQNYHILTCYFYITE